MFGSYVSGKKGRLTRIFNVYNRKLDNPSRYSFDTSHWDCRLAPRTILAGDFNSRSPYWDARTTREQRDTRIANFIDDHELLLNNDPEKATRREARKGRLVESTLDLTLSTSTLGLLPHWTIDDECTTPSDHEIIIFTWSPLEEAPPLDMKGWNLAALEKSPEHLSTAFSLWKDLYAARALPELNTTDKIDEEVSHLEKCIKETLDLSAPTLRLSPKSKKWWTEDLKEKHKVFMRHKRQFQRGLIPASSYRELRNSYYRSIRQAKRITWERFLAGEEEEEAQIPPNTPRDHQTRCWQALQYCRPKRSGATTTSNLEVENDEGEKHSASSLEEKERVFLKQAFPGKKEDPYPIQETTTRTMLSENDFRNALFNLPTKTAPGNDTIGFRIIRLFWSWDATRMHHLFSACLSLGYHPSRWKVARRVILPKPNKLNYNIPRAYRVISLLCCFSKLLEKAITIRLTQQLDSQLYPQQFGGRPKRGTLDALLCLVDNVERAWKRKNIVVGLLLDIKGAFDCVSRHYLVKTLSKMGVDSNILHWVHSFLSERKATLIIDGFACPEREVFAGLPQGSPISPFLWAVYIHK